MTTYSIIIAGTIDADSDEDVEGALVKELLPWENIDTANFTVYLATHNPDGGASAQRILDTESPFR